MTRIINATFFSKCKLIYYFSQGDAIVRARLFGLSSSSFFFPLSERRFFFLRTGNDIAKPLLETFSHQNLLPLFYFFFFRASFAVGVFHFWLSLRPIGLKTPRDDLAAALASFNTFFRRPKRSYKEQRRIEEGGRSIKVAIYFVPFGPKEVETHSCLQGGRVKGDVPHMFVYV